MPECQKIKRGGLKALNTLVDSFFHNTKNKCGTKRVKLCSRAEVSVIIFVFFVLLFSVYPFVFCLAQSCLFHELTETFCRLLVTYTSIPVYYFAMSVRILVSTASFLQLVFSALPPPVARARRFRLVEVGECFARQNRRPAPVKFRRKRCH